MANVYLAIWNAISAVWKAEFKLSSLLNWYDSKMKAIFPKLLKSEQANEYLERVLGEKIAKKAKENEAFRHRAFAAIRMVQYLCTFKKIHLWNPKEGTEKILTDDQVERLKQFDANERKSGITPFQLFQKAYSIGIEYAKRNGDAINVLTFNVKEQVKLDAEILVIAKVLNNRAELASAKRKANKAKEQPEKAKSKAKASGLKPKVGSITIEQILKGEVNIKDVNDTTLLDEAYKDADSNLKRRITMRKKALV